MIRDLASQKGNVFAMMMATVAMVALVGVAAMNLVGGPITTAARVTHQNMAQNDLLMNAKVIVMNASTLSNRGDEDGDGYIEPVPFVPISEPSCGITLPTDSYGGCLPADIGAILTDPWGTLYAYCVWDHGDPRSSTNRIDGEDSTSGAVLAIISAGPNKRFETPCTPYDGDPDTNDDAINPAGARDDLVQIYTYAAAVAGSGGLWELKSDEPQTAVIDKKLEVGDVAGGTGFAFDTATGQGEFPYIKADFIASRSGGATPVTMDSNIALDGKWLSGDGGDEGIFVAADGSVGVGTNVPEAKLHVVGAVAISSRMGANVEDTVLPRQGAYFGWNEINGLGRTHFLNHQGTGGGGWEFNAFDADGIYQATRLIIDQHGNVGIGTDSPANKLTIAGGLEARSNNVGPDGSGIVHRLHTGPTASESLSWIELWGEHATERRGEAVLSGQNIVLRTGGDIAGVASLERLRITPDGNMGIGTPNPNPTAKLDIASTTQGFLPPRMTTVQRDAISNPAIGLMVFNVTDRVPEFFDGTEWLSMFGAGGEAGCAAPWGDAILHGSSITAYQSASVAYGSTCASEDRFCINGELIGSFAFETCSVQDPSECTLDGVTVPHGDSRFFYNTDQSPNCAGSRQTRTCTNGILSGSSSYSHANCDPILPSQCTNYSTINDPSRNINASGTAQCDSNLATGWYRFTASGNTNLPTTPPIAGRCGTSASGWMNFARPTTSGQTTTGTACFHFADKTCNSGMSKTISATNCGSYNVYYLVPTAHCYIRYCTTN